MSKDFVDDIPDEECMEEEINTGSVEGKFCYNQIIEQKNFYIERIV